MTEPLPDELEVTIRRVLTENGISGNQDGLHGWRCAYPDMYGECSCLAELIADLVAAVQPLLRQPAPVKVCANCGATDVNSQWRWFGPRAQRRWACSYSCRLAVDPANTPR